MKLRTRRPDLWRLVLISVYICESFIPLHSLFVHAYIDLLVAVVPTLISYSLIISQTQSFVKSGGRFPVAVLAANRPDMLKQTLLNLLKVDGAQKEDILIFQVMTKYIFYLV